MPDAVVRVFHGNFVHEPVELVMRTLPIFMYIQLHIFEVPEAVVTNIGASIPQVATQCSSVATDVSTGSTADRQSQLRASACTPAQPS